MENQSNGSKSQAYIEGSAVKETRALVAELCRHFYTLGWVSGTGGSITIKAHDESIPKSNQLIVMSPSGVQKERMVAEDMYVLGSDGSVLSSPSHKGYPHKPPKCTECAPLFMKITHMEMIKGIQGHGYHDELVIPIVENTAREGELTDALSEAIEAYPKATAVLVRNHGIYVWGDSWISAKTQAECYHYLFDAAIRLHQLGLDWSTPSHGPVHRVKELHSNGVIGLHENHARYPNLHCILLDIEGTTTPISFVTDVLFPYAHQNVRKHLDATYDTEETQEDIKLLRAQVEDDLKDGLSSLPIPPADTGKEEVIASVVANGHIWRVGYQNNELEGVVFADVHDALEKWHALGIKVYIYSSGSREAQRLIFGKSNYGDLRKYLYGFFDTTIGHKRDARSYSEISLSLGVDRPSEILFLTDVYQEALAAKEAGLEAIITVRPGNAPLPENHGFKTVQSFSEI
ncbi:hypothetical protein Scep_028323 [Stephania cephalantha]|uniref:Class II aldolase/adducin N-terminal domain-containing protein n=1 Tax=Stephania cephalantha TaxID=152367 RepID=A0AAP0E9R6_9MAGN